MCAVGRIGCTTISLLSAWPGGFSLEVVQIKIPLRWKQSFRTVLDLQGCVTNAVCICCLTLEMRSLLEMLWPSPPDGQRQTSNQQWFISTSFLFSCEGWRALWPLVSLLPPLSLLVHLLPPALQRPAPSFNMARLIFQSVSQHPAGWWVPSLQQQQQNHWNSKHVWSSQNRFCLRCQLFN